MDPLGSVIQLYRMRCIAGKTGVDPHTLLVRLRSLWHLSMICIYVCMYVGLRQRQACIHIYTYILRPTYIHTYIHTLREVQKYIDVFVGTCNLTAAMPPRCGICMQLLECMAAGGRCLCPGRLFPPSCTPETESGIGASRLNIPEYIPRPFFEVVADSGPGGVGSFFFLWLLFKKHRSASCLLLP